MIGLCAGVYCERRVQNARQHRRLITEVARDAKGYLEVRCKSLSVFVYLAERRVKVPAAEHIEDGRVAIRSGDHPIGGDRVPVRELHTYCCVVVDENALDFGSEADTASEARDLLLNEPDHRLRPADAVSCVAGVHPGQRKHHGDGGKLSDVAG